MKFGPVPPALAQGAILAHSVRTEHFTLKKGARIGPDEITALQAAGLAEVVVAQLEAGDVSEDAAANRLAACLGGDGLRAAAAFTGRANLFATHAGILQIDRAIVDALNALDEAVTFATLEPFRAIAEGDMVATVKIIPYAISPELMESARALARPAVRIAPFRRRRVAMISTLLPGLADKVVEKTLRVTRQRLTPAGAALCADLRVPHAAPELAVAIERVRAEGAECIIVFGASAIVDRRDVIPAALEAAGGRVERLGMPVDPGNLLMLGVLDGIPVLGAPGCARSPKENGFDWVLMRCLADVPLTASDIGGWGVGGLLGEIITRPQPRGGAGSEDMAEEKPPVAAIVLAAGRGTRMGGPNKLLEEVGGRPVVRRVVEAALASRASSVLVVTGHERARVERILAGLPVTFVHNPAFAEGLSTSVRAGISAVPDGAGAALVMLGDMPLVGPQILDTLVEAFDPDAGRLIVLPVADGRRGNPVLWDRRFFDALAKLEGDVGARHLIAAHAEAVVEIEVEGPGAFLDVDTPEALSRARAQVPEHAPGELPAQGTDALDLHHAKS
ncbi:NTP transferase domain-containing protein [Roseixanthobacter glucoisosaccharinicivorans]|uniref:NTP transferase domain-containing protein n=1 Tax=Roseixanthobacter glucoisosaccharinicivorans TaxID=3119923 RepID=UPI00372C0825